uniref:Uncharacterized protein n=1 Tax=viral metagenome TaxID=1070528 RepID=A0A6C0DCP9_9ZZZZ
MSYGPVIKGRTHTQIKPPYVFDYDAIINSIIDLKNDDAVRAKALEYRREQYETFVRGGLPTKIYEKLLIRILERFREFTREQLQRISTWLFSWEEESLTGIMKVKSTDAIYGDYAAILQAVFGDPIPFRNQNGELDLANSTIVLTINEIMKPCPYGNGCRRANPLHKKWRHPLANVPASAASANAQGGLRRRTQRKRNKQRKNKRTAKQRS